MFCWRFVSKHFSPVVPGRCQFGSFFRSLKVTERLSKIYNEALLPLEERHLFHEFHSPRLNNADFECKPAILLMGQYSTGKTTFIRYLLKSDFPGLRIGPEPTTDKFIVVMYDENTQIIPGHALIMDHEKPFAPLSQFGNSFLTKFQCSTLKNELLENMILIDTPGILSGDKQRTDRGYNFPGVLHWFAERVDRVILLFDAHKLDISDEFRWSIESLRGNDDKIRILLNKSDMLDHQSLMRIYGSLMWSLGKIFKTPEVPRVYVGSFWEKPVQCEINKQLFVDEEKDLLMDLHLLPKNVALRKLNDLTKRARLARVHAYIMDALRSKMPLLLKKESTKGRLIEELPELYVELQKKLNIPAGDFPDVKTMAEVLKHQDFSSFKKLAPKLMRAVDDVLAEEIAKVLVVIEVEQKANDRPEFKVVSRKVEIAPLVGKELAV